MTQEDVRRLLDDLGGKATVGEVSTQAKKKFPERSLHTYVGQNLRRLEKKGLVTELENKKWELTDEGKKTSLGGVEVSEVNTEVERSTLNEHGLEVANLVGTIQAEREFDLNALSNVLSDAEYHPESSPLLIYRSVESATLLVPTNGMISIVGAKSIAQTKQAARSFFDEMDDLGINICVSSDDILVQNIVLNGDFGVELDLDVLSINIGLERCEYEPEQFPGIVFQTGRTATVLIFRTGKYVITGTKSYASAFQVALDLTEELRSLGIDATT